MKRLPADARRCSPRSRGTGDPAPRSLRASDRCDAARGGMNVDLAPVLDGPAGGRHARPGRGFGTGPRGRRVRGRASSRAASSGATSPTPPALPGFGAAEVATRTPRRCGSTLPAPAPDRPGAVPLGDQRRRRPRRARLGGLSALDAAAHGPVARIATGSCATGWGSRGCRSPTTCRPQRSAPAAEAGRHGARDRAGVDLLLFAQTYDGATVAAAAVERHPSRQPLAAPLEASGSGCGRLRRRSLALGVGQGVAESAEKAGACGAARPWRPPPARRPWDAASARTVRCAAWLSRGGDRQSVDRRRHGVPDGEALDRAAMIAAVQHRVLGRPAGDRPTSSAATATSPATSPDDRRRRPSTRARRREPRGRTAGAEPPLATVASQRAGARRAGAPRRGCRVHHQCRTDVFLRGGGVDRRFERGRRTPGGRRLPARPRRPRSRGRSPRSSQGCRSASSVLATPRAEPRAEPASASPASPSTRR